MANALADEKLLRAMNAPGGETLMQNIDRAKQTIQSRQVKLITGLQATRQVTAQTRALFVNNDELQPFLNTQPSARLSAKPKPGVTRRSKEDAPNDESALSKSLAQRTNQTLAASSRVIGTPNPLSTVSYEARQRMKSPAERNQDSAGLARGMNFNRSST